MISLVNFTGFIDGFIDQNYVVYKQKIKYGEFWKTILGSKIDNCFRLYLATDMSLESKI